MLLQKTHIEKLIQARLNNLARHAENQDPKLAVALVNEFTAMRVAVESLPEATVPPEGLAKADPLDTATDMVQLKIRQLSESNKPSDFMAIERLCKLGLSLRQACSNSLDDFENYQDEDDCMANRYVGGRGEARMNPMRRRGAPYGMGENPGGGLPFDINDLYREVITAFKPMVENRVREAEAGIHRDAARELDSLLKARTGLQEADLPTENIDKRIADLSAQIGNDDGADTPEPDLAPPPPVEPRDPACGGCQLAEPHVIAGRRVHPRRPGQVVNAADPLWDPCNTEEPQGDRRGPCRPWDEAGAPVIEEGAGPIEVNWNAERLAAEVGNAGPPPDDEPINADDAAAPGE